MKVKQLKEVINQLDDDAELKIGSGKREYPVDEIFESCFGSKIIFATRGFANWKHKQQLTLSYER